MPQRRYYGGGYGQNEEYLQELGGPNYDPYSKRANIGLAIRNTINQIVAKRKEEQEKAKLAAQEEYERGVTERKLKVLERPDKTNISDWQEKVTYIQNDPSLSETERAAAIKHIVYGQTLTPQNTYTPEVVADAEKLFGMKPGTFTTMPPAAQDKFMDTYRQHRIQKENVPTDYDKRYVLAKQMKARGELTDAQFNKVVLGIAEEQEPGIAKDLNWMVKNKVGGVTNLDQAYEKRFPKTKTVSDILMGMLGLGGGAENKPTYTIGERKTVNGETREFVGYDENGKDLWKLVTK